jgi:hypothetical protein
MNSGQGQTRVFGLMLLIVARFANDSGGTHWSALGGVSVSATSAAHLSPQNSRPPNPPQIRAMQWKLFLHSFASGQAVDCIDFVSERFLKRQSTENVIHRSFLLFPTVKTFFRSPETLRLQ